MGSETLEKLLIRKIKLEDAGEISRIEAAISKDLGRFDFERIIREQVGKDTDAGLAAEVEGRVVGYMIGYILYGGFGLEKSAWIATLGVDPKYMGQGIGKRLAEEVFRVYREKGIRYIYTSVRWDSVDLLSFFKTLGFDRSNFINLRKDLEV